MPSSQVTEIEARIEALAPLAVAAWREGRTQDAQAIERQVHELSVMAYGED